MLDFSAFADPESKVVKLELSATFATLYEQVRFQHPNDYDSINIPIIALDPGETTGVAVFDGDRTIWVFQKTTKHIGLSYDWLCDLLSFPLTLDASAESTCGIYFQHLRYEDYRVYDWKSSDHSWSPIHTLRWIGAIQVAAYKSNVTTGITNSCCMAQQAKGWWTDTKLDYCGLKPKGLKHGKDALRHLLYFILFPKFN